MIAQTEQQKEILAKIEELRMYKENLKSDLQRINDAIIRTDIQIRDIRQSLPKIAEPEPVKPKKQKETLTQKHNRLMREIADIELQLGVKQQ